VLRHEVAVAASPPSKATTAIQARALLATGTRSSASASMTCSARSVPRGGNASAEATANAYAERWVGTVRAECLDWLLIVGRGHLEQVLRVYVKTTTGHRPHRALGLEAPDRPSGLTVIGEVSRAWCIVGTCSAVSCRSTGELHELVCAPHTLLPTGSPSPSRWHPTGAAACSTTSPISPTHATAAADGTRSARWPWRLPRCWLAPSPWPRSASGQPTRPGRFVAAEDWGAHALKGSTRAGSSSPSAGPELVRQAGRWGLWSCLGRLASVWPSTFR
jgi:hypothetical protein